MTTLDDAADDLPEVQRPPTWYGLLPSEPQAWASYVYFAPDEHPDAALTPEECDRILEYADAQPMRKGLVSGEVEQPKVRDADVRVVTVNEESMWIFDRLMGVARAANSWWNFELTHLFNFEVLRYEPGQHYVQHVDIGPGMATRKLSMVAMLSDAHDYEGGDLELLFGAKREKMRRQRGTILFFPSWMLHRVTPVKSGVRRTLTAWVQGPSFR